MSVVAWIWLIVGLIVLSFLLTTWFFSGKLYRNLLVRQSPDKWARQCSFPDDEEYCRMFEEALAWNERWKACMRPLSVESDGLKLRAQYYDFGADCAVIIIPGRTEGCLYSCYFAEPYRAAGYNVLTIDNRAHGLSEGKYPTLGARECHDLLAWGRLLNESCGVEKVVLHGICIGASSALNALTLPDCPDYMAGMTADGMYTTFYDSFKAHMLEEHHPNFPITLEVMGHIFLYAGSNVVTDGPICRIGRLKKPILFLHSREDRFSLPEKAQLLYDSCRAPKMLHFFQRGAHSRIRIHAPEEYDACISEFLKMV